MPQFLPSLKVVIFGIPRQEGGDPHGGYEPSSTQPLSNGGRLARRSLRKLRRQEPTKAKAEARKAVRRPPVSEVVRVVSEVVPDEEISF